MSDTQHSVEKGVDDILAEFFPDGMPLSRTQVAMTVGTAQVISSLREEKPLIDLTQESPPQSQGDFMGFMVA